MNVPPASAYQISHRNRVSIAISNSAMNPLFAPPLIPRTVSKPVTTCPARRRRPRPSYHPAAQLRMEAMYPAAHDAYIQCVECLAVYQVEPEEVEGTPRVVSCSACLHEWVVSDADLLWGHEEAVEALATAARRRVQGSAFVAARGVEKQENDEKRKRKKFSKNGRPEDDEHFNVFVGNLSFRATEEDLYRAFSGYGAVLSCQVPEDASGASRGFGFVEMRSKESALRAMESLQGSSILGRDISLNEAKPRRFKETNRWKGRRKDRYNTRREEQKSGR